MQALSNTLIEATTIRYANILQRFPALRHVVNTHGADRKWGSAHPDDCAQGNYFYSPPTNAQIHALREAQSLKQTNSVNKYLGAVYLDEETQEQINKGNLSLIITIPPRCIHIHPSPNTRFPKKKGTSHLPIGIILGINSREKTANSTDILIAMHTLHQWKKKHRRAATIHETSLIAELTKQPLESLSLQEKDWHDAIRRAWKWTTCTQRRPIRCEPTQRLQRIQRPNEKHRPETLHLLCTRMGR
jgi:hypothetical protein